MSTDSNVLLSRRSVKKGYDSSYDTEARLVIAQGALTNSKRPESFVHGVYPTHLTRSFGCKVTDTQGNDYIDFICGLGTNLLGYGHESIKRSIVSALDKGTSLSLSTPIEVSLGKLIQGYFPFMERVKFLKTGSEACSASIRMARAFTNRSWILSEGYHGWHDEFVSLTPPASGIKNHFRIFPGLNPSTLGSKEIAAIIVEPVITDWSESRKKTLQELREFCTQQGIVLIFDETITGLRFPGLSVSKHWGIEPDILIFGKALAGGMPLSCVGGKEAILNGDYFVSSTFAGEILSLHAAHTVLSLLNDSRYSIDALWSQGKNFWNKMNDLTQGVVSFEGYPTRGIVKGDEILKSLFFQECCESGLLLGPSYFLSFPHVEVFDFVLSSVSDIVGRIKRGEVQLKGNLPQTPFAQKVRSL